LLADLVEALTRALPQLPHLRFCECRAVAARHPLRERVVLEIDWGARGAGVGVVIAAATVVAAVIGVGVVDMADGVDESVCVRRGLTCVRLAAVVAVVGLVLTMQ
jgi:hypothetical protein